MEWDNDRGRFAASYDAGQIVDGVVALDESSGHYVLIDDDGAGYDPQVVLRGLIGKKIRLTLIAMESLDMLQDLLEQTQSKE